MFKFLTKIFHQLARLTKAEFHFKKPYQNDILIFDKKGSDTPHFKYFLTKKPAILHVLGEKINLYIIFRLLLKFKIPSLSSYIEESIKIIRPRIIFHNSYNIRFFQINKKKFNFEFKKIFTQSELKNHLDFKDFIGEKKNLSCDNLFVWSEGMKINLSKYIIGNYEIVGSFANNEGPKIQINNLKNKLIFVSQFRTFKKKNQNDTKQTIREVFHGLKFSWDQFYAADLQVAKQLKNFCLINNIEFEIVGTSLNDKISEKNFFREALGNDGWKYLESSENKRGIYLTNEAKYIVTIDSTLGYECLSRGQRVCFFSIRSKFLNAVYSKFGWTMNLDQEGPCWTSNNEKKDFKRIMDFLIYGKETEWEHLRKEKLNDLLFYDPDNQIFKNFLKKISLLQNG